MLRRVRDARPRIGAKASPDTVARAMSEFARAGVGTMMCGFLIDLDNLPQLHRSIGLFKEKVMPRVAA
jgi:alkanesulfonate monooxygenase SsuD/methylene tetrahydromethanopterin reductase-like flavin-dependent oxidoreductase (luciferase family)